jgi:hypothetical protein
VPGYERSVALAQRIINSGGICNFSTKELLVENYTTGRGVYRAIYIKRD